MLVAIALLNFFYYSCKSYYLLTSLLILQNSTKEWKLRSNIAALVKSGGYYNAKIKSFMYHSDSPDADIKFG